MEAVDSPRAASSSRQPPDAREAALNGHRAGHVQPAAEDGKPLDSGGTITVLAVAGNSFTRAGAVSVLQDDDRLELVGTAASGRGAIESVARLHPDLVAVQLAILADEDGVELVTRMEVDPRARLVLFDGARVPRGDGRIAVEALRSADSYVSTNAPCEVICEEIARVGRGNPTAGKAALEQAVALVGALPALSDTHRPVLELAAAGLKDAEIAKRLGHSVPTIKKRLSDVRQILGAANTPGAVGLAMHLGLIEFVGDQLEGCAS